MEEINKRLLDLLKTNNHSIKEMSKLLNRDYRTFAAGLRNQKSLTLSINDLMIICKYLHIEININAEKIEILQLSPAK